MGEDNENRNGAPFNMAIDTLKRIADILQQYTMTSIQGYNKIILCQTKYGLCKQLLVTSVPLINDIEAKKTIQEKIGSLDKEFFAKVRNSLAGSSSYVSCYMTTEDKIDKVVMYIQETLQKEGYFMPPKNDPRFSWKQ